MSERSGYRVTSVPQEKWPKPDRLAWEVACRPGERLRRGGSAAYLKPVTRNDLARRYGYFLDHLQRHGLPVSSGEPAGMVVPERVATYIAELQERVGSVTVYGSIYKLRRAAELLNPNKDFGWLQDIENDLDEAQVPRSKFPRLVLSSALVGAGLAAADTAERSSTLPDTRSPRQLEREAQRRARGAADRLELARAVAARDGLMVALLAMCPIRAKNFAALELGVSFRKVGTSWWIVLPNEDTKAGRWDERQVPALLTPLIDGYVDHHRLVLSRHRADVGSGPLWLSERGCRLTASGIDLALRRTTKAGVGIDVGPHAFRTAAATESAALVPQAWSRLRASTAPRRP